MCKFGEKKYLYLNFVFFAHQQCYCCQKHICTESFSYSRSHLKYLKCCSKLHRVNPDSEKLIAKTSLKRLYFLNEQQFLLTESELKLMMRKWWNILTRFKTFSYLIGVKILLTLTFIHTNNINLKSFQL